MADPNDRVEEIDIKVLDNLVVSITGNDGNVRKYQVISVIDRDGDENKYALLGPLNEDDPQMLIFTIKQGQDGIKFGHVEDDTTYKKVREAFADLMRREQAMIAAAAKLDS